MVDVPGRDDHPHRRTASRSFASSSGGRTQSGLDAFGLDLPYLPGQADPWDSASPFHAWQPRTITPTQLMKALGLHAPVTDVQARYVRVTVTANISASAKGLGADKVVDIKVDITPDDGIWTLRKLLGWRSAEASGVAVVVEDEPKP